MIAGTNIFIRAVASNSARTSKDSRTRSNYMLDIFAPIDIPIYSFNNHTHNKDGSWVRYWQFLTYLLH